MVWHLNLTYSFTALIIVYLMTCAGYFFLHKYFILFPSRKISCYPKDYELQYEDLFFTTSDNVQINGWFIKGESFKNWNEYTIILFSGNKGTMPDFLFQVRHLVSSGFNVFLFSYRGFGKSQKKWPTEEGVYKDSEAACEYLMKERNTSFDKIIFLGQSLGCAMAARTAGKYKPFALILEGGFTS